MFSIFRRLKTKPQTKNSSFYYRENLVQNADDLKKFCRYKTEIKTKHKILFQGKELNKITPKSLENSMGDESFILNHEPEMPGHVVYFYRKNTELFKLVIQVHFFNNTCILASTKVTTEAILTHSQKKKIVSQLLTHYSDIQPPTTDFQLSFSDEQGNKIFVQDEVYLHINYIPESLTSKDIDQLLNNTNLGNSKSLNEDMLDQFI